MDDEDDEFFEDEEQPHLQFGHAEPADMSEEQEQGPTGISLEGRTVCVWENGELRFRSADPALYAHVKMLHDFAHDARVAVIQELINQAEQAEYTANFASGLIRQRLVELLSEALDAAERSQ